MANLKELAIQAWQTKERERKQEELRAAQERIPEVQEQFRKTFGISVEDAGGKLIIIDGKVFVKFTDFMVRPCYSDRSLDGFAVFPIHPSGGMVRAVANAYSLADLGKILANPKFIDRDSQHYEAYWTPQNDDDYLFCPLLSAFSNTWYRCRDNCAWWSAAGCRLII
jgi:hypothetical protein